jgi:hypothetical protein
MSCDYIQGLSIQTWEEVGSPTAPSSAYIFAWYKSAAGVGKLNNTLNTCFSIVSGSFSPEIGMDELAIYKELYKISYYDLKVSQATNSAISDSWLELNDDVSSIKRHNKNEVAKTIMSLRKDSYDTLKDMIFSYQQNHSPAGFVNMGDNNDVNPYGNTDLNYNGGVRQRF